MSKLKSEGRYSVGGADGLHLRVVGNSRAWVLRVVVGTRINSKGATVIHRRDIGLGGYPEISLAEARDIARERRKQIRNGIDPLEQKKHDKENSLIQQRNAKTFRECAQVVIENKARELKNSRQYDFWRTNLEKYVFPTLGDRIIGTITRATKSPAALHVAAVLKPVWQTKHKTAKEMRGRIETVLDYAKAMEYFIGENPAAWKGVLEPIAQARSNTQQPRNKHATNTHQRRTKITFNEP